VDQTAIDLITGHLTANRIMLKAPISEIARGPEAPARCDRLQVALEDAISVTQDNTAGRKCRDVLGSYL
jgi:hypothetical protein